MVFNPYNSLGGKLKCKVEEKFPILIDKFFEPFVLKFTDLFYIRHCRKHLEAYISKPQMPIFKCIEIETINKCNAQCTFCPASSLVDKRPFQKMSVEMFEKIIEQLVEMNYQGELALHSNNEPLLDNRIVAFARYAKQRLPKATVFLYTNGTLLKKAKFFELMQYLDFMVIDNYNDSKELIEPIRELYSIIESEPYRNRVYICIRKQNEILFNRGGESKNRSKSFTKIRSGCVFPFEQFVVRPDGRISLCCNDAAGECTLGDLNNHTILEVWNGEKFKDIRMKMVGSRQNVNKCKCCDTMIPYVFSANPVIDNSFKVMICGYKYVNH